MIAMDPKFGMEKNNAERWWKADFPVRCPATGDDRLASSQIAVYEADAALLSLE